MTTPEETKPGAETPATGSALTAGMRRVLWIVGALVVVGISIAIWFFATSSGGEQDPDRAGSPAATSTPTRGPLPGATPTTGSEVLSPAPTESGSGGLPPLPTPTPLIEPPLPESGSATGSLVDGFPTAIVGPVPESDILDSSIASDGTTMQVTLVARTDASADGVEAHYRQLWVALGLSGLAQSSDIAYSDAYSSLTLAFTPTSGTGTVYMIYGVLRTS